MKIKNFLVTLPGRITTILAVGLLSGWLPVHAENPPTIDESPEGAMAIAGDDVKLTVDYSGSNPLTFQWLRDGQSVAGATDDELQLRDVEPGDSGAYSVSVSNAAGSALSAVAHVQVIPFLIKNQPVSRFVETGSDIRFEVGLDGESPFTFQWFRNGVPIPGATAEKLQLNDVTLADDAVYSVRVTNPFGTDDSAPAVLEVVQAPEIVAQPQGVSAAEGDSITLSVAAIGTPAPQFQWYREGKTVAGATGPDLMISPVIPENAGRYEVRVSNAYGSIDSQECLVVVVPAPVVMTQPQSQSARVGNDVTFSAQINLNPAPLCQWYFNGEPMTGETGLSLRLNDVEPEHAGAYTVAVENVAGRAVSEPAILTVDISEVVARVDDQPQGAQVLAGADLALEVKVAGAQPLSVQWRQDGVDIPGATLPKLIITGVHMTQAGRYTARVSNRYGSEVSADAVLDVAMFEITRQPADRIILVDEKPSFEVRSNSPKDTHFEWLFNGQPFAAADHEKLELPHVRLDQEGVYSVRVHNDFGSVVSQPAFLRVDQRAAIVSHPERVRVEAGSSAVLAVVAEGEPTPNLQWYRNGIALPGETGDTLVLDPTTVEDAGYYSVEASNEYRSETSDEVLVRVVEAQELLLQPQSQIIAPESDVVLKVAAVWHPTPSYQWRFNGVDIPGATEPTLELNDVQAAECGAYNVLVSNEFGSVESETATIAWMAEPLRLQGFPQFTKHPVSTVAATGSDVRFEAQTTGPVSSNYQWYFNGAPIPGATIDNYQPRDVTAADEGVYHVVASNIYGSTVGAEAVLVTRDVLFTEQPKSAAMYSGESHKFKANGTAEGLVTYQWRFNDQPIGGAISSTYELTSVKEKNQGVYTLDLITDFGILVSDEALMTVPHIIITGQPESQHLRRGTKAVFDVSVEGRKDYPFTYQWFFNGRRIDGAIDHKYEIPAAYEEHEGDYNVEVTLKNDELLSEVATLSVGDAPSLLGALTDLNLHTGETATFSAAASGGGAMQYQWFRNGVSLPGQNSDELVLGNLRLTDSGVYSARVSNEFGVIESAGARLEVVQRPIIVVQPKSRIVPLGGEVRLEVAALGHPAPSCQWLFDGQMIPGATEAELVVRNLQPVTAGDYTVVVFNTVGSVESQAAQIRLDGTSLQQGLPAIVLQPESQEVLAGQDAEFEVKADGSDLSYQWLRNGEIIPGANSSELKIESVQANDEALYQVHISNPIGVTVSDAVSLTVTEFIVAIEPINETVPAGDDTKFRAVVTGSGSFTYQWHHDDEILSAETDRELELTDVETAASGYYRVAVRNQDGVERSAQALLVVRPVLITRQPQGVEVAAGEDVTLSVAYDGATASAQWYVNGQAIQGATSTQLNLRDLTPSQTGRYSVSLTNQYGGADSDEGLVIVSPAVITLQPQPESIRVGDDARFEVRANGDDLGYQWFFGGTAIAGADRAQLDVSDAVAADAGVYSVEIFNSFGSVMSVAVGLEVLEDFYITNQPVSISVPIGETARFSVEATGPGQHYYQWYRNGAEISGATARVLELPHVAQSQSGSYQVHVWTNTASINSDPATLTVIEPGDILSQSDGGTFAPGTDIELSVSASGTPEPDYQWLLNGEAIPGATESGIVLANAQPVDSGDYSVIAYNELGAEESDIIPVRVEASLLPFSDEFASRGSISGAAGTGSGSNVGASRQNGEPKHAGKDGDHSVWLSWLAPASGVATIATSGSSFDTLLGIYVSSDQVLSHVVEVASDDDEGGYHASQVQFVVVGGVEYIIAVDGFDHANGDIVLHWTLDATDEVLPAIGLGPQDTTLNLGSTLVLSVDFQSVVPVVVQWHFNGSPISGADQSVLTLNGFDWQHVGTYSVWLSTGSVNLFGGAAEVQINTEGLNDVAARDKLADAVQAGVIANGPVQTQSVDSDGSTPSRQTRASFFNAVSGYSGTQIFSTLYAGKDPGEPNHCGIIGGASYWFTYQPPTSGWLELDTNGSSFDTILAVYTGGGAGTGYDSLVSVDCDNNSGTDHRDSALVAEVEAGRVYYIVVDGVYGAKGTVRLNYYLNTQPIGNHAPVASGDLVSRSPNQALSIYVPSLLENDFDQDGDALSVIDVTTYTVMGGYVSWQPGSSYITYYPPYSNDQEDYFEYAISDGKGGTASTMVTITVGSGGAGGYY